MPELQELFRFFIRELTTERDRPDSEFVSRFNNEPRHKKGKFKPRTNLMRGTLDDLSDGVLSRALHCLFEHTPHKICKEERCYDLIVFDAVNPDTGKHDPNKWYSGKRIPLLVAEIEENLLEFKGTLSDLIAYQAPQKLALLYEYLGPGNLRRREQEIKDVVGYWQGRGLSESQTTECLVVLGPPLIRKGIGEWHALWFKSAMPELTHLSWPVHSE